MKPLVEQTYRTNGRDVVLGESLAALFVVETYLVEPSLFDGYGAVDPSLWWDKEALSRTAGAKLADGQKGRSLFLAIAKEQLEEPSSSKRLVAALRKDGITYCLAVHPELTHATIYQQLTPEAVQYLLSPAEVVSPKYGFNVRCSDAI